MFVSSIDIRREGYYMYGKPDPTRPFLAKIEVQGQHGKVELNLSPELSAKVVSIIAEEVAEAGRATAEAMTASVFNVESLPAKSARRLSA